MMAVAIGLCLTACDDYDDTDIWNTLNEQEERIAALEEWQQQVNGNIAAIQELLNTTDYITSVTEITSDGKVVGYTIEFLKSEAITIYNGTQGDAGVDGETPQIGLTQGTDGNWYWTLNGELMTDTDGNPIRANGEDGKDGQDGADGADGEDGKDGQDGATGSTGATGAAGKDAPTPQIKLGSTLTSGTIYGLDGKVQTDADDDAWYLSVDNGKTWYRVTGATGAAGADGNDGDSFFKEVDSSSDEYVTFTLSDGSTFTVPKYQKTGLTFYLAREELTDLTKKIYLTRGALTYTVSGDQSLDVSARFLETETDYWTVSVRTSKKEIEVHGFYYTNALLEVTLSDNGEVLRTYRLPLYSTYPQGNGTEQDPYLISTVGELLSLAKLTSECSSNSDEYFQLTKDIDLTGEEWYAGAPFEEDSEWFWPYFRGILDGNGHTIKGLTVDRGNDDYAGLFGMLYGTVKNLTLESPVIKGRMYVGTIAGYSDGGAAVIENCKVTDATITGTSYYGAWIGDEYDDSTPTTITNSNITGTINNQPIQ